MCRCLADNTLAIPMLPSLLAAGACIATGPDVDLIPSHHRPVVGAVQFFDAPVIQWLQDTVVLMPAVSSSHGFVQDPVRP